MPECNIVFVGKNRNGTARYWCPEHHAPAYGKNGVRLEECPGHQRRLPGAGCRPELTHRCEKCGMAFRTNKKPVSNPFVDVIEKLRQFTGLSLKNGEMGEIFTKENG